ncbi:MAG: M23 family metallopeptidase [Bacteriovoracia bacterium]
MKYLFLVMLISQACATAPKTPVIKAESLPELMKIDTQPGMVRWVTFKVPSGWEKAELWCKDQRLKHVSMNPGVHFAYIAETYFSDLNTHQCRLKKDKEERSVVEFSIKPYKYKEEYLKVNPRKVTLAKKDLERAQKEQRMLNELYSQSALTPYFAEPFRAPLNSHITSVYGIKRVYNKAHRGQHLGTDYRAAVGVPVPAVNRGRIMFAGDLFYTGGTVIIDHGMDIFTVYGHLSEVKVEAGQIVNAGDIVALSGNTGRSSGPHLHWGVKIHGHYIDGYSLIEETKKQFP